MTRDSLHRRVAELLRGERHFPVVLAHAKRALDFALKSAFAPNTLRAVGTRPARITFLETCDDQDGRRIARSASPRRSGHLHKESARAVGAAERSTEDETLDGFQE